MILLQDDPFRVCGIILCMFLGMKKAQIYILFLFLIGTCVVWCVVFTHAVSGKDLTVAFLDVGQGDAIFIETPNGTQVLLDGGPNKSVLWELGSMMPFWDRTLDMVIISHPDLDHVGGLPAVLNRFEVEHIMSPGVGASIGAYGSIVDEVVEKNIESIIARPGRVWLDKEHGVYMDILFPDRDVVGFDKNLASIVAKLVYGKTSFLLTGDSPKSIEKYLVDIHGNMLDVDVLKLGHHGPKTSTSEEFLGYTSPEYAIISAGKDNRYGHPHQEVTDLLEQFDVVYFNTANDGLIVFESNGKEVTKK